MADFSSGWARVIKRNDEHYGLVGKVTFIDIEPSGIWVTLEFRRKEKIEEVMFEHWEVMECPAPKPKTD
jgi:hypothetical protein